MTESEFRIKYSELRCYKSEPFEMTVLVVKQYQN